MAVPNVTEFANAVTMGNVLSTLGSPALVKNVCMMGQMHGENLPVGSQVKSFVKYGSLTAAATLAESTAQSIGSDGELADSKVDATAVKAAIVSGLSVEAEQFSDLDLQRIASEQFSAIARKIDDEALSLFSGLSQTRTASSLATVDDLMLCQMTIYTNNCPEQNIPLTYVTHPKGGYGIRKDIIQSGASAWSNPSMLDILGGQPQQNCFIGEIPGVARVFQTTGLPTSGGDTVGAVFHPKYTFAGIFASAPQSWVNKKGSEGFYTEIASYFFYDLIEWNDLLGVAYASDT